MRTHSYPEAQALQLEEEGVALIASGRLAVRYAVNAVQSDEIEIDVNALGHQRTRSGRGNCRGGRLLARWPLLEPSSTGLFGSG